MEKHSNVRSADRRTEVARYGMTLLRFLGFDAARPCAGRRRTDSPRRPECKPADPSNLEARAAICVWRESTSSAMNGRPACMTRGACGNPCLARERQQRNE